MKLILGMGGSPDSFRALETMLKRYQSNKDDVTLALLENPESELTLEDLKEEVEEYLDEKNFDAEVRQLRGQPGPSLVQTAETEDFDLIVLGGGERSPMGKYRVGRIAEYILVNSPVSVTLIR